jgi:hypothetical protein
MLVLQGSGSLHELLSSMEQISTRKAVSMAMLFRPLH